VAPRIGVALKWVPLHVEIDPLTGTLSADARFAGCSAADQAALEWALRLAEDLGGQVVAATAGPAEADSILRDALAAGASSAVRVDMHAGAASDEVASGLGPALERVDIVCCGNHSIDRGSGSVPAFLAARLGLEQALGLVRVEVPPARRATGSGTAGPDPVALTATRRLDYGRREVLAVQAPTVLSFEGGTAELRRAPLAAVLRAREAAIEVVPTPGRADHRVRVTRHAPYRPRPRVLPAPGAELGALERILAITGAAGVESRARTVTADTDEAADLVLDQLREWGYLP
jgi:electron transfer flavoprotein beta subunit